MASDYDNARAHAQLLIRSARDESGGTLTPDMIAQQVDIVLSIKPEWKTRLNRYHQDLLLFIQLVHLVLMMSLMISTKLQKVLVLKHESVLI